MFFREVAHTLDRSLSMLLEFLMVWSLEFLKFREKNPPIK